MKEKLPNRNQKTLSDDLITYCLFSHLRLSSRIQWFSYALHDSTSDNWILLDGRRGCKFRFVRWTGERKVENDHRNHEHFSGCHCLYFVCWNFLLHLQLAHNAVCYFDAKRIADVPLVLYAGVSKVNALSYVIITDFNSWSHRARWLLARGRIDELASMLEQASIWNSISLPTNFMKTLNVPQSGIDRRVSIFDLFQKGYKRTTFLMTIVWFSIILVYFGITLHMSSLGGNIYVNTVIFFDPFLTLDTLRRRGERYSSET